MTETINTKWLGKMAFEWEINGHHVTIDAKSESGGENKGPQPKAFMLAALGGCTAMDVTSMLEKMKINENILNFNVKVSGELTEEHPKHFSSMHVVYEFTPKEGKLLPLEKIEKAIKMSEEKYCGVAAVYKKALTITSEIVIL